MTPDIARAAVVRFLQAEGLAPTAQQLAATPVAAQPLMQPDLGPLQVLRGALGTFWVSGRGRVVLYTGAPLPGPGPQPHPPPQPHESALAFVRRHVEQFDQRAFKAAPITAEGGRMQLRWAEQARVGQETAIFPNWIELSLALPAGGVVRASWSDLRLARQSTPRFTRADVLAWVKQRYGQKSALQSAVLELAPKPGSDPREVSPPAITLWNAEVMFMGENGPETERVSLDADSGALLPD